MSGLSKTAQKAMNAGANKEAKKDPFDTNEKKIIELVKQREAKLFVVRMDFVDALIEEYLKTQAPGYGNAIG